MSTPADIIRECAAEYMGNHERGDYCDVITAAYARMYQGPEPPADDPSVAAIAALVEQRHTADAATTGEWPADYAAALMVATFGTPDDA